MNAGKVKAHGPGLEPKGNIVGQQAIFTVETVDAGKGTLEISILDPKGKQVKCESVFNKDRKMTYSCMYIPQTEGDFKVFIYFDGKEIPKSPFSVRVEGAGPDASKVTAQGPGLEKEGVVVNTTTYFEVSTKDAGKGNVDVTIIDPAGYKDKVKAAITPSMEGLFLVEYTAAQSGLHSITIYFGGKPIPQSPFSVMISSAFTPRLVYTTGRGIQPRGMRVKQQAEFKIHTKGAGTAELKVQITGPGGISIKCDIRLSKTEEGVYECMYIPTKIGQYVIHITFGAQHITKSPFYVDVGPEKISKIVAYGPGLEAGFVDQPTCFIVEMNGEPGVLEFSIEGTSPTKVDYRDLGDGSVDVKYWPKTPGEYAVHIISNDDDIPQSPYMAQIQPATTEFDASKVIAKGPGLEKTGIAPNQWAEFIVDPLKAGKAQLYVRCLDTNYNPVTVEVKENKDGTYSCRYKPKNPVRHTVTITWGSVSIPESPFRVDVTEPSKLGSVKVSGPGVEKGVKTFVKTHFTVDCKTVGAGDVAVFVIDEKGEVVPINMIDNGDRTFTVEYLPTSTGTYTVQVYFAGKDIPVSQLKVNVESGVDISKVTVKGLDTPLQVNEQRTVTVGTAITTKIDAPCEVIIIAPSGKITGPTVTKGSDGYSFSFMSTEAGLHSVTIKYANQEIPKSPFTVIVEAKKAVTKVTVMGLEEPITLGESRTISVNTSPIPKTKAACKVTVATPGKKTTELTMKETPDGYTTSFTPTETGLHKIDVTYDKTPVESSPFSLNVEAKKLTPKVDIKGLEKPIQVDEACQIIIDTSTMPKKDAPCKVSVTSPKNKKTELTVKQSLEGYTATFTPTETGTHTVTVKYDKKPTPDSPISVEVLPKVGKDPVPEVPKRDLKVTIKGLETPIALGETRQLTILTSPTPKTKAPCAVTVTTPTKITVELPVKDSLDGYTTSFHPVETGLHKVEVLYDKKPVEDSPFTVGVESKKPAQKVEIKGLEKPIQAGETHQIVIDTSTMTKKDAPCKVTVTTPKKKTVELTVKKAPEGYTATLAPTEVGTHEVTVTYDKTKTPDSPLTVDVIAKGGGVQETETRETGVVVKGLDTPVTPGEIRLVTIVTTNAAKKDAQCKVTHITPEKQSIDLKAKKVKEGYETTFFPEDMGTHIIKVEYDGKEIHGSPFELSVEKRKKAVERRETREVSVTGLETPLSLGETRKFTVLVKDTEKASVPLNVSMKTSKGETLTVPLDLRTESYDYSVTATASGEHKLKIDYSGVEVSGSPFTVTVETVDVSKVVVKGLEAAIVLDENRSISVITAAIGKEVDCKVTVTSPKNQTYELPTFKTTQGHGAYFTPTETGTHKVTVECAGQEVPGSPFSVVVEKKSAVVRGLESLLGMK